MRRNNNDEENDISFKELAVTLFIVLFSVINIIGLVTINDGVKELKDQIARVEKAQEKTAAQVEKFKQTTQANTDVCLKIISGEW